LIRRPFRAESKRLLGKKIESVKKGIFNERGLGNSGERYRLSLMAQKYRGFYANGVV